MPDPTHDHPDDQRVRFAGETLDVWNRGNWANAPADLAAPMAGHLAAAVRSLLEVVGEAGTAAAAPSATAVRPDGSAVVAAADVPVLLGALADAAGWTDSGADAARYRSLARSLGDDR